MKNHIHLIKLSVGTETVDDLAAWQEKKRVQTEDGFPRHVTRMWPKREPEILRRRVDLLGYQRCDPVSSENPASGRDVGRGRRAPLRDRAGPQDHPRARQPQTPVSGVALPCAAGCTCRSARRPRPRRASAHRVEPRAGRDRRALAAAPAHASPAEFEFTWQNEAGPRVPLHFALKLPPEAHPQDAARMRVRTAAPAGPSLSRDPHHPSLPSGCAKASPVTAGSARRTGS